MQGTWVWSLVLEDPTGHRATKQVCHNSWCPCTKESMLHNKRSQWEAHTLQLKKARTQWQRPRANHKKISVWRFTRNESPCQGAWQSQIRELRDHQPSWSNHLPDPTCYWGQLVWNSSNGHPVWTCWNCLPLIQPDLLSHKKAHFSRSLLPKQLLCSHGDSSTLNGQIPEGFPKPLSFPIMRALGGDSHTILKYSKLVFFVCLLVQWQMERLEKMVY